MPSKYSSAHYQKNRSAILDKRYKRYRSDPAWRRKVLRSNSESIRKRRQRVVALLGGLKSAPCADCKQRYPHYIMDFDHVRGRKKFSLGHAANRRFNEAEILKEVAKCEVVCSNCHRERTHKQRQKKYGKKKF